MHKRFKMYFSIPLIALLAVAPTLDAAAAETSGKRTFVLGRISDNPPKHQAPTKAMADYLAEKLKDQGIQEARVLITKDAEQMLQYMKEGKVDLVNETIFTAVRMVDEAGGELLLRANRKGAASYRTAFYVRKDGGIRSLTELRGRVIAFEDPNSTSGYMLPAAVLLNQGLGLTRLQTPTDPVPAGTIGYVFSGDEKKSAQMVQKREVHASVFSNTDIETEKVPAEVAHDVKTIHQTVDFPRSLMVVRRQLSPALKERLQQVLMAAHDDPRAEPLLEKYHGITKFEPMSKNDQLSVQAGRQLGTIVRAKLK